MMSVRRGWGTQRANLGALQRKVLVCLCSGDPAPSGPPLGPEAFCEVTCARDQAPRESTLGPLRHTAIVRLHPGDPAPSGPPLGP